jgi:hypothetical protein
MQHVTRDVLHFKQLVRPVACVRFLKFALNLDMAESAAVSLPLLLETNSGRAFRNIMLVSASFTNYGILPDVKLPRRCYRGYSYAGRVVFEISE